MASDAQARWLVSHEAVLPKRGEPSQSPAAGRTCRRALSGGDILSFAAAAACSEGSGHVAPPTPWCCRGRLCRLDVRAHQQSWQRLMCSAHAETSPAARRLIDDAKNVRKRAAALCRAAREL